MMFDKHSRKVYFTRRQMLKSSGAVAGALALGSVLRGAPAAAAVRAAALPAGLRLTVTVKPTLLVRLV